MPTSTRFAVAVQTLSALALMEGMPLPSDTLAGSVNTNPAVIRRLLGQLAEAGITTSQLGQGGGALLAEPAANVTLLDVFRAVEKSELFGLPRSEPNGQCIVGCHIRQVLGKVTQRAQAALEQELQSTTIADVVKEIQRLEKRAKRATRRSD